MRLHATRKSCDQGEITVLAIVETVLAVALLFTLSVRFNTSHWLAVACVLAPLTLLETPRSQSRAILSFESAIEKVWPLSFGFIVLMVLGVYLLLEMVSQRNHLLVFVMTWLMATPPGNWLLPLLLRCWWVGWNLLRHPLEALATIPKNWRQVVLATDSFLEPNYMPAGNRGPLTRLSYWGSESRFGRWQMICDSVLEYPLCVVYRWSVKATCIVYLPLVWLVNKARYRADSTQHMLSDYLADEIQTVRRWALALTGGFLIVKIIVLMRVDDIAAAVKTNVPVWGQNILRTLHPYLTPRHIELWQLTPALNGLLAVGMWLYARRILRLGNRAPAASTIQFWWNVMSCITLMLSLYSIACLLKITWDHGDLLGTLHRLYEAIEWRFFPQTTKS
jgi:hypothetical protein